MGGESSEIVVEPWSARYAAAYPSVARREGGFVNHPNDPGGATKYGVSLRFLVSEGKIDLDEDGFADFDLDMDGDIDVADIKALSPIDAQYLFHRCFWQRLDCESFPHPTGEMMFDQGVNGGLAAARKLLQRAINKCLARGGPTAPARLQDDGDIGDLTRAALDWVVKWGALGMPALVTAYREAAADRYRALAAANPKLRDFLRGWLNRAEELGR